MADKNEQGEKPPPHYEGGIPILAGPEEREKAARESEKKEEAEYKRAQTAIQSGIFKTQVGLLIFGLVGAAISAYQAHTARIGADEAKRSADTAAKQLEMIERPWLSIVNPRAVTPLAWGPNGMQVTVQFGVKNTGPSPAPMLLPDAEIFVLPPKPPGLVGRLAQLCGPSTIAPGTLPELVVPPNAEVSETMTIGVGSDRDPTSPIIVAAPIISIRYRSTFGTQSSYPYCTAVSYALWPVIFKSKERAGYFIPRESLILQVNPMSGEILR